MSFFRPSSSALCLRTNSWPNAFSSRSSALAAATSPSHRTRTLFVIEKIWSHGQVRATNRISNRSIRRLCLNTPQGGEAMRKNVSLVLFSNPSLRALPLGAPQHHQPSASPLLHFDLHGKEMAARWTVLQNLGGLQRKQKIFITV